MQLLDIKETEINSDDENNILEPKYNLKKKKNKSFNPNNINIIDINKTDAEHDVVNNNGDYFDVKDKDFDIIKETPEIIKYDNRILYFIILYESFFLKKIFNYKIILKYYLKSFINLEQKKLFLLNYFYILKKLFIISLT